MKERGTGVCEPECDIFLNKKRVEIWQNKKG